MPVPKPKSVQLRIEPDERQRQAIEHSSGPLLVIAGAGTGKTTVLTRRVARLIQEGHAQADEVLALTYTDNAAQEMRERVSAEIGRNISGLQVMTFHAYCHKLLIRNGLQFGVLDDKDLWIYLRKRIHELQLNYFVRAANVSKFMEDLLDFMRRCQDELVGPEKYAAYVSRLERGELPIPRVCKTKDRDALSDEEVLGRCQEISRVFAKVEQMLAGENLGTFGHMITRAYDLLLRNPAVLAHEREHSRFILVDEFQDANFAQVKILQALSEEDCNVFAVGDPDQAIYRFRGASSAAFALFQRTFPSTDIVVLDKNRRSTTPILKCAHSVISQNPEVFAGTLQVRSYRRSPLISFREEEAKRQGTKLVDVSVDAVVLSGKDIECSDLAETILHKRREFRCKWSDFAVLYRQHHHRDDVVQEFIERGIPYSIENMDVMDTPQARDLLACIGAVVSEKDDASLFRVAALPQFTIDPEHLRAGIKALPREQEHGLVAAVLPRIDGGTAVLDSLQQVREEVARTSAKSRAAVDIIIRVFKFDPASPPLKAILAFIKQWEQKPIVKTRELPELLEYLDLFRQAGGTVNISTDASDAVRMMTVHVAKGLEYTHVFIIRANSPSFPLSFKETLVEFPRELRDPDSVAQNDDKALHTEEERRLFYVAMTRAKDSLTLYANRSKSKKDPTPAGYFRDLFSDSILNRYLRRRPARGLQGEIFAQASAALTGTAQWVGLPPASNLSARLSASAVQTYKTCPLQFKLDREWRIPGEVPAAMQYGGSMHRVLRTYYDSVRMGRELTEEALIELFRADLADAGIQDRYQHELYQRQGIDQLKAFLAACRRNPTLQVLHTEEFFEVKIGNTAVIGRIDRIDKLPNGEVVVVDYKTGKPQSQDDADESLQLSIYALAARQKWGYKADHLAFYNLDENNTVITRRSESDLQAAEGTVEQVAAEIAAGHFNPKPTFNCRFCAYRSLCPATEKRLYDVSRNPTRA